MGKTLVVKMGEKMTLADEIRSLRERTGATFFDVLRALAEDEGQLVQAEAQAVAARFYEEANEIRANRPAKEHARYTVRVVPGHVSPTIRWVRIGFKGPKNGRRRFDQSIPRGKGAKYPSAAFLDAQPWEKGLILTLEDDFGILRMRSTMVGRMVMAAAAHQHALDKAQRDRAAYLAAFPKFTTA